MEGSFKLTFKTFNNRLPQIWPCKYVENVNVTKRIYVECEAQNLATLSIILKRFADQKINRLDLVKEEFCKFYFLIDQKVFFRGVNKLSFTYKQKIKEYIRHSR